ncbi:hypothetical protein CHS0354_040644 [Potamilus streckersoni]|uniref:Uncharacterized protein n=1 Tax=Potamilus streckersoni TaxID=2493646 RepID=A0AAE0TCA5_9BIVA|nr:hypothetical protein CHS0354_040644 [Potamilus streckersoni]
MGQRAVPQFRRGENTVTKKSVSAPPAPHGGWGEAQSRGAMQGKKVARDDARRARMGRVTGSGRSVGRMWKANHTKEVSAGASAKGGKGRRLAVWYRRGGHTIPRSEDGATRDARGDTVTRDVNRPPGNTRGWIGKCPGRSRWPPH